MRFLLFTLYAPLGSMGEIAVGERRMGWARPGRSAVLGLVAAAMGVDRGDEDAHRALQEGLYFAVRTDAPGQSFTDYHTAQAPSARRGATFATRRAELAADKLNTVLSSREWRTDSLFTVALWPRPDGTVDMDAIKAALEEPRFVLYLGRKSAPLGLPPAPRFVDADSILDAFAARERKDVEKAVLARIAAGDGQVIAYDGDAPGAPDPAVVGGQILSITRRDAVASRTRWQFQDRAESIWIEGPAA